MMMVKGDDPLGISPELARSILNYPSGRPTYYTRQGEPITDIEEWARLLEDREGRIVRQEHVGPYWISTVWIGYDMQMRMGGPPLIFETMVFAGDGDSGDMASEFDMSRYSTEAQALAGHEETVLLVRATLLDVPDTLDGE